MFRALRKTRQYITEVKCDIVGPLRVSHPEDTGSSSLEWSKNPKKTAERPDHLTRGGVEQGDWLVLHQKKKKKKLAEATVPSAL